MRAAVTFENGEVFRHFGRTGQFKLYELEGGRVAFTEIVEVKERGHGRLASLLKENGVEILICGGIGEPAQAALKDHNIRIFGGASGDADKAVEAFLNGQLVEGVKASCSHHHGKHGCGGHHE